MSRASNVNEQVGRERLRSGGQRFADARSSPDFRYVEASGQPSVVALWRPNLH